MRARRRPLSSHGAGARAGRRLPLRRGERGAQGFGIMPFIGFMADFTTNFSTGPRRSPLRFNRVGGLQPVYRPRLVGGGPCRRHRFVGGAVRGAAHRLLLIVCRSRSVRPYPRGAGRRFALFGIGARAARSLSSRARGRAHRLPLGGGRPERLGHSRHLCVEGSSLRRVLHGHAHGSRVGSFGRQRAMGASPITPFSR